MDVKVSVGAPVTIQFDLAEMGSTPRDMGAVVAYMNGKLKDAGLLTRFAREKLPPEPRTVQTKTGAVKLPDGPDRFALKIAGVSTEKISFDAPDRADAVFLAQTAGKDGALTRHLTKFQTDAAVGAPPPAHQATGEANWVDGRVFAQSLGANITVRASAAHSDGSVYMVAEVEGPVANQTIKGERDVALLKYDASGGPGLLPHARRSGRGERLGDRRLRGRTGGDRRFAEGRTRRRRGLRHPQPRQLRHRVRRRGRRALDPPRRVAVRRRRARHDLGRRRNALRQRPDQGRLRGGFHVRRRRRLAARLPVD
jgi:hypothetical protein